MKKLFGLVVVLLTLTGAMAAQGNAGQGAVAGNVTDASKAVIPGAHVVLANPSIGYKSETTTNSEGHYSFTALTVGAGYSVTVTAKGFSTGVVTDFSTSVGTVITQNVALAVGAESTTIEVAGGNVEQVQTDTTAVSQLIDNQVWQDSPLSVRNSNSFVGLVAGASPVAVSGRGYAVNGARSGTGNFQVEGADNNDQGLGGAGIVTISPDAIQEYRVITSVPAAEYGRAGGFTTDTVLKSGTKTWHGSAFEYNRIQALAQESWTDSKVPAGTPPLRDKLIRNQFGGSIGGPIYKDRTFFYATAEFERQSQGGSGTYTGITQDFYNFVKSGAYQTWMEGTTQQSLMTKTDPSTGAVVDGQGFCPEVTGGTGVAGATCPGQFSGTSSLGPIFSQIYAANPQFYPFGTQNQTPFPTDLLLGEGNITNGEYLPVNIYGTGFVVDPYKFNENRGSIKLDHKLTSKDQLSFSYLLDLTNGTYKYDGGEGYPGPSELQVGGAQLFTARYTRTLTANLLNDFKAGYTRHVNNIESAAPFGLASEFVADSPSTGFGAAGGIPQLFTENEFTYEDAVSYSHGKHNMKGGFRFIRTRNGSSFYNDVNGTVGFWGAPGLLTDARNEIDGEAYLDGSSTTATPAPGSFQGSLGSLYYLSASQDPSTQQAPDPYRGYRANEFSAYAEDDWKITPRLLLSYGVRWEYFGPPHNFKAGVDSNVYFGSATSITSSGNPFEPNVPLLAGEQGAAFKCVGYVPCGNAVLNPNNPAGYAAPANRSTIWNRDLNNFGPRFGFSYDTFGNGKLVVRGGFGVGYDRLYNNVYENIRFNGPHFVDNTLGYGAGASGVPFSTTTAVVTPTFHGNSLLSGANPVPRHVNQNLKTAYYEQIHFGVETQIAKGYVLEANYIGTLGRQLVGIENANTFEGRVACYSGSSTTQKALCKAAGYTTLPTSRPTSLFGNDNFRTNGFSSNYSGGQVSLRKGYSNGFQFLLNYTYSKAMDEISDVFTVRSGATGITSPYNPSAQYGPADFDVRHLAVFTVNYRTHSERHKLLLAGWGLSPTLNMRSGAPIYTKDGNSSYDPNKDGTTGVEKIIYSGPGTIKNALNHAHSPYTQVIVPGSYKPYTCPATVNAGLFCDVPGDRQSLYGLRQYNLDAALSKHIDLTEKFKLTLQAAFFDVDGHPEWADPVGDINSSNFGKSLSAGHREGQLSGRIDF
jgi:hypothetical protein